MISKHKNEPEWMLEFRLNALESFLEKPTPTWGGDLSGMDFDDIYYYIRPMENQGRSWDDVPDDIKNTFEKLGIPQAEREILAGVGAQYESEVVYHSLKKELEEQGVIFLDMDSRPARARGHRARVLRDHHPAGRQQVRGAELGRVVGRLVRVHPAWRQRGHPASGVLPHQRGEHGPVRADAHHRRRGLLRPLHRGLHGPDVYHELAALGGGRADRQAGGAHPLLDHPELVAQHLQPGDQAGRGPRERHHRVGGRQPGLQADHEVPGGVPGRRGRAR